jgi:Protein of unknown function (DUF3551)
MSTGTPAPWRVPRGLVVRAAVLGAAAGLALAGTAQGATRGSLPWCAVNTDRSQVDCDYATLQQCLAEVSGVGGPCIRNPAGAVSQPRVRKRRR